MNIPLHTLSKECAVMSPGGRGKWETLWFRDRTWRREGEGWTVGAVRGKRGGWDGDERGLRASAATIVMAQTRWRGEQWSEARGEAVVTLLQRHMSWQLVTTQPITQTQTQTHSHYPTHQTRPASTAPSRYQHKCDKHIRIDQHSLSTPSTIIRPMIISYMLSKTLVIAIFIIIDIIFSCIQWSFWTSIHLSISIHLFIHWSMHPSFSHSIYLSVCASVHPSFL